MTDNWKERTVKGNEKDDEKKIEKRNEKENGRKTAYCPKGGSGGFCALYTGDCMSADIVQPCSGRR